MKTLPLRYILCIVAIIAIGIHAFCNGSAVLSYSSICRVAEPQPRDIYDVSILSEKLHISHTDGYNIFKVEYTLKNNSDSRLSDIDYGFPIDYYVSADSTELNCFIEDSLEGYHEIGWVSNYVKDISFTFNGVELPFQAARESIRNTTYDVFYENSQLKGLIGAGINRRWFYTRFSIEPGAECQLTVTYSVYAKAVFSPSFEDSDEPIPDNIYEYVPSDNQQKDLYESLVEHKEWRNRREFFVINYDFSPAAHWGEGTIPSLEIEIDLSNLENCAVPINGYFAKQPKLYYYDRNVKIGDLRPFNFGVFTDFTPEKFFLKELDFWLSDYTLTFPRVL